MMFDYEIMCYKIEYKEKGAPLWFETTKKSEEDVLDFIKAHMKDWENYRVLQIRNAIIDLYCED